MGCFAITDKLRANIDARQANAVKIKGSGDKKAAQQLVKEG